MAFSRILVTGSSGLIGSALVAGLTDLGHEVVTLDLRADDVVARGDVRDTEWLRLRARGCDGVIHLAAVSRVITGERDPELCWATNVEGFKGLLEIIQNASPRPWLIFASSREVYGQPTTLPANEDCPVTPVNVYGRSKVEGERMVERARHAGLRACTIRLSNVFGSVHDHKDRVVPAFARAAALGHPLRIDGSGHTFDFTHICDVSAGILALVRHLVDGGAPPPPIHFVSGTATTLGELAALAVKIAGTGSIIREAPPRNFDVARFVGDGTRARLLLDWVPRVTLQEGLERLIADCRSEALEAVTAPE